MAQLQDFKFDEFTGRVTASQITSAQDLVIGWLEPIYESGLTTALWAKIQVFAAEKVEEAALKGANIRTAMREALAVTIMNFPLPKENQDVRE